MLKYQKTISIRNIKASEGKGTRPGMISIKNLSKKKLYYIAAGAILLCCLVTRLWRLDTLPSGIHFDEAGMAYDAWCLSQYGVDRYLISWPVYLNNFGGGQSVLYAYLCAGLFRLFGYSIWLVRLPAVLFSLLTVLYGMKIARKLYPESYFPALATGVLLTICPYLVLIGRLGLDCFLTLGASTVFLYYFICAIDSGKYRYYVIAGFIGGLLLYTYILTYVILPVFLLLALIYVIRWKRFSLSHWTAMAIPMGVLSIPLILTQLVNIFDLEEIHLGIFTCIRLISYRTSEFKGFQLQFLKDLIYDIFIYGDFEYCSIPDIPTLYYTTIPLFVIGLLRSFCNFFLSLKNRKTDYRDFVFTWFLIVFFLFCTVSPNGYRICGIYYCVIMIAVEGLLCVLGLCRNRLRGRASLILPSAVSALVTCIYLVCFVRFGIYYYLGDYTRDYYPLNHFHITVTEAVEFIREHPQYGPKETQLAEPPIHFALSTLDSPYDLLLLNPQELYVLDYFHCSCLGEIEKDCNYIVRDIYAEYADKLRAAGFTEINYGNYSLFYYEGSSENTAR